MPQGITQGSWQVTLQGIDITDYCQESSFDIEDTLGQGPGVAAGSSGRATKSTIRTSLGPAASAVGAGATVTVPTLVRQGELRVFDAAGNCVFGGYVTDIIDQVGISDSGRTVIYTDITATDYWQDWDRINIVSAVYDGQTDIAILRDLISTYAPSFDLSHIPASGGILLGPLNFKNISLQKAVQKIADKYGYAVWISYADKAFHYAAPGNFANAPFALSTSPDFISTFQLGFTSYEIVDTDAINRVTFYGGKQLSSDYTQDLSPLCNGNADVIPLAYYPHKASDGLFHVAVGGAAQAVGFYGSTGAANTLRKNGGSADVLINIDAHTLIFNVAPNNTGINSATCTYRFEAPLVVQIADNDSVAFYGRYLDGTIVDNNVFDTQTAVARCRTLLNEQSLGLTTLKVNCWKAGIQSGMLLRVEHDSRNIHETFLVQEVDVKPLGAGNFRYEITAGAWHWNLIDFVMATAQSATTQDDSANESEVATIVRDMNESVNVSESWTKQTRAMSGYVFGTAQFGLSSF